MRCNLYSSNTLMLKQLQSNPPPTGQVTFTALIEQQFVRGSPEERAELIANLWLPFPDRWFDSRYPREVSNQIALAMTLYDRMEQQGELAGVQSSLNYAADQLLQCINAGSVATIRVQIQQQARLCRLALRHTLASDTPNPQMRVNETLGRIEQAIALPDELTGILQDIRLLNKGMLYQILTRLVAASPGCLITAPLVYNPLANGCFKLLSGALQRDADYALGMARYQLAGLNEDEKLLIPLMALPMRSKSRVLPEGHFSALLAVRSARGLVFIQFDSHTDFGPAPYQSNAGLADVPYQKDNTATKINLIRRLIPGFSGGMYFYQHDFPLRSDSAIYSYYFYQFCLRQPTAWLIDPQQVNRQFNDYTDQINSDFCQLHQDEALTAQVLRMLFVLHCLEQGYLPGSAECDSSSPQQNRVRFSWGIRKKLGAWLSVSRCRTQGEE